jgi:CBS-domain-containing membrane protein
MRLPVACFLTALGGFVSWHFLGVTPLAAAASMAWGIAMLRLCDLHVPPALAVALLPLVMDKPTIAYPFAVGIGTTLLSLWFLAYQRLLRGALSIPWASRAAARQ